MYLRFACIPTFPFDPPTQSDTYIYVPHLWLTKIVTQFQQEFTVNNSGM